MVQCMRAIILNSNADNWNQRVGREEEVGEKRERDEGGRYSLT